MPSSPELYALVCAWLQALPAPRSLHPAALRALAHLITALLIGQSLRPSALMRALPSPLPVPARQRYKRVARAWTRPWLSPAWLTPRLVTAVLALVSPDPAGRPTAGLTHLALDSVHCGRWDLFTIGVVWHGRVLPVSWAVLPSPWPKRQFTPTVCALVRQVVAAWPAERPAHLVADRGFPSRPLFRLLDQAGWGWTLRLRATSWVRIAGQAHWVRPLLTEGVAQGWTTSAATQYATGPGEPLGTLVVGRGLPVLPRHQCGPASLRVRADQYGRRQAHVAHKHPHQRPDTSRQTDGWMVLFTSHPTWLAAVTSYGRRWAAEGTYRDAQTGWDGQHGWDLTTTVARLTDPAMVERVVGLWALGALIQTWVGHCLGQPGAALPVPLIRREWTTTGRLSVWARGQLALTEPTGRLRPWLRHVLTLGARRVARGPRLIRSPTPQLTHLPVAPPIAA
jgi:hypothetical protein